MIRIVVSLVGGALVLALLTTGRGGHDGYVVRAAFDSASGLRAKMEVRTSGVTIGDVREVTLDQRDPGRPQAIAVLDITAPDMRDFRATAHCTVRATSLAGDRYVDCSPRAAGAAGPPLRTADVGGERQHVLPISRTSSPVDPDLVLDIFRLPVRQRLSIIINELGAGLAGNGDALRETVRRADPALLQLNRALASVSEQRRQLASLADSGERVLEPLAREREHLAGVARNGAALNAEIAGRDRSLQATFRRLPAFLTGLRSTLRELDGVSSAAGPVLADLDASAGQLSTTAAQLEPLAKAGTPAVRALGRAAGDQQRGLQASRPVLERLGQVTTAGRPVSDDLRALLSSLEAQGGIERLADAPRALSLTANGFDRYGYFSRTNSLITSCSSYVATMFASCGATFAKQDPIVARAARRSGATSVASSDIALLDYLLGKDR